MSGWTFGQTDKPTHRDIKKHLIMMWPDIAWMTKNKRHVAEEGSRLCREVRIVAFENIELT